MFSRDDKALLGAVLVLIPGVVVAAIGLVLGLALMRTSTLGAPGAPLVHKTPAAMPAPPPEAPSPAEASRRAALAASDAASVMVEHGVVKFYFASGKADLAAGAGTALEELVAGARAGRTLVVAGFHDATGDALQNAGLAQRRALAVRSALRAAGVADRQIVLKKPESLAGSGSDAEARRVEISLQ